MLPFRKLFLAHAATLVVIHALAAESPVTLPATLVTAKNGPGEIGSPTSPSLAEAQAALRASAGAVNFIPAAELAERRAASLTDMLTGQPGVFIRVRNGLDESRISIRGSGLQRTAHGSGILLLQDGLPLNLADGFFDMQRLDPAAYSRIEVHRGATGLGKGSGTLGGAIDCKTFTGHDAPPLKLGAEAGSYGYAKLTGTAAVAPTDLNDHADATVTATHTRQDGWRDTSEARSHRVNGNVGMRLSGRIENRLYYGHARSDTVLPGSLTKAQLETNPRQAAPGNVANPAARNIEWNRFADRLATEFDDATVSLAAGWQGNHLDHPISGVTLDQASSDAFVSARLDYTADLAGRRNRFSLGTLGLFGVTDDKRFDNPAGPAERGAQSADIDARARSVAVYAEEDHYFTRALAGTGGVRLDYADRDYAVKSVAATANQSALAASRLLASSRRKEFFGVSPSLGGRYEFARAKRQVFANVSRSYQAPTLSEFSTLRATNPNSVDAQQATTVEVGTRGTRGAFGWDLAYYYAFVRDEFISSTVPNTATVATLNADDTRHQGVECGLEVNLVGGDLDRRQDAQLILRQVAGWNDFRFNGDRVYGDNRIAGIPAFTYRVELTYRHPSGFYIGPHLEVVSKGWIDHLNSQSADAYALLGARAGFRRAQGFGGFVELRNLLDTTYAATTGVVNQATAATAAYSPGEGFGAYAGIEYRW